MRTSKAQVSGGSRASFYSTVNGGAALGDLVNRGARYLAAALATIMLAAVALVVTPGGVARADTVFQSGQVFASVGFSTVNVYDPASGDQITSLVDDTGEEFTTGSAFDAAGNFYVTDDSTGNISEFSPTGAPMGQFATGLTNPESLVFDSSGNLYVGQQTTPYIAEFSPTGQSLGEIGPLSTELFGDDWIDLSSDQCTFYYTSESTDIMRYNKCTNTQEPNFNQVPFTGLGAFEVRILQDGDVLVADSDSVLLLDQNGNVIQTYSCASLPGCQGLLFGVSVDPDGTSFWTGDSISGDAWQINIATGQVLQTIQTQEPGFFFGLSVDGQLMAATSPTVIAATPTTLTINPVSGNFSTPTPVSGVLTNSATDTPIPNEQVTFTLNGNETCTATTDDTGTASCVITPTEPSQSYTLSASFSGDSSSQSSPIGSDSTSTTFTVNPDTTSLTYTGPTTAVNGQPSTLSGTLTTDTPTPGTPLTDQVVTFNIGSQTCSGTTDGSGDVSCQISPVNQPVSDSTVTANYAGSSYESPTGTSSPILVQEPTTLTVKSATGDYADATTVSGVLTDTLSGNPIPGEKVTLSLDSNESCSATTDGTGTASCSVTPSEPAATYPLTGSFGGDTNQPLQLMSSNGSSNFVVTLEQSWLTYTGPTIAQNGNSLTLSGVLTTDDPSLGAPIAGRTVNFVLGAGSSAQTCTGVTDTTGTAECMISSVNQSPGPIPVTDTFPGDAYYQTASAHSMVNLPEGTQLTVTSTSGVYNGSTPVTGTLTNTYTGNPVPNEPVTLTINGTQSCTATTNGQGVATCDISPNEPSGTYSLSGSFPGDQNSQPQLLPSSNQSGTFTVTPAPTSVTYTGPTTVTNGQPVTLSGVVTSSEPTAGTPIGGESVTFTVGSGSSAQSCTGTSAPNGDVSCTVSSVNQSSGTVTVTSSASGNNYYQTSPTTSTTVNVQSPTTLTVTATTGQYGAPTTVNGTLTNSVTGQPVAGQPVTLTLNGTLTCTAVTGTNGQASCSITPNEPAGSYTTSGSFGGGKPATGPSLLPSSGSNTFVVTKAPTTVTNTSPTIAVTGMPITLSATVSTAGGSGPGGLPVTLTLGSGSSAQSCTGTASATGVVTCTITDVNQIAGSVPLTVTFGGNSYYQSSSTSVTETTAAFPNGTGITSGTINPSPAGGGFVVGDISADGSATGLPVNGTNVNFWGSQLWKTNQYSGVNNAPASMKGYIDNAANYVCGAQWTSDPGNSSNPPSTIPVNMVVVVASAISQSGSTEYGNIKHLAVVQVAPGYGPAPGHDGYGKIIGYIC